MSIRRSKSSQVTTPSANSPTPGFRTTAQIAAELRAIEDSSDEGSGSGAEGEGVSEEEEEDEEEEEAVLPPRKQRGRVSPSILTILGLTPTLPWFQRQYKSTSRVDSASDAEGGVINISSGDDDDSESGGHPSKRRKGDWTLVPRTG